MLDALPNSHAALVHFPIGLLVTAVTMDLVALATPRRGPSPAVVTALYVTGSVCLIAAYLAGRQAASIVYTPGMAHPVVLSHWNLALWSTVFFVALSIGRLVWPLVPHPPVAPARTLFVVCGLIGVVALLVTADRGGELVYRWGVGVIGQ